MWFWWKQQFKSLQWSTPWIFIVPRWMKIHKTLLMRYTKSWPLWVCRRRKRWNWQPINFIELHIELKRVLQFRRNLRLFFFVASFLSNWERKKCWNLLTWSKGICIRESMPISSWSCLSIYQLWWLTLELTWAVHIRGFKFGW